MQVSLLDNTNNDIALQTQHLHVGYKTKQGEKTIVKDINLSLSKGKLVCLLGPNGVGKSTLLRSISGIQKPIAGTVLINNKEIQKYSNKELANVVSLVLTDKVFAANLTVYDIVSLGRFPYTNWIGKLSQEDKNKIDWAINATHINYLSDRKIFELSDGQYQKVMIARALAQDGDIIILDEPTAFLDLSNRIEIMLLLKQIARDTHKGILISTHELEMAIQTADLLWIIPFLNPVMSGTPEDLILNGSLAKAFYSEQFNFDINSGKFIIESQLNKTINLVGEGIPYFWTKHALEKAGYQLDNSAKVTITINTDNYSKWEISDGTKQTQADTIEEMINHILIY